MALTTVPTTFSYERCSCWLSGAGLRRGHGYGGMHGDYALAGTRSRGTLESRRGSCRLR